jgi:lipopolysaccharide transport system ATP-binding protein
MFSIEVQGVSKIYKLYHRPFDRLKEILFRKSYHQSFQAIENISFALPQGGILGVIGDNGAGKSTLLKLLTGTLVPTIGQIVRRGRIAALLELGTGFHPELSGRQNIYLNASLLGLTEEEIKQREADIIAFSELEEFIDRPIKTYSSGMYVRLAFSIATTVDPDILIIDEALSVGDAHFQKKCIERMMQFKEHGKTILFCSHSLYLVRELCNQTIWLEHGKVRQYGETSDVISSYLAFLDEKDKISTQTTINPIFHVPEVVVEQIDITSPQYIPLQQLRKFETILITVHTKTKNNFKMLGHLGIVIEKPDGQLIFVASTKHSSLPCLCFNNTQQWQLKIPKLFLISGSYRFRVIVADEAVLRFIDEYRSDFYTVTSEYPEFGLLWMEHQWLI